MDLYCEQLVVKNAESNDVFKKVLVLFSTIILSTLLFFLSSIILSPFAGFIVAGVVLYFGLHYFTGMYYEYEYIITNGELDIDKIVGRKKRKRLITITIGSIMAFGKFTDSTAEDQNLTKILAHDGIRENLYYADFKSTTYGLARLLFSPNEKVLSNIKTNLPRNLRKIWEETE